MIGRLLDLPVASFLSYEGAYAVIQGKSGDRLFGKMNLS